jgi:hypothetical protein
MIMTGGNATCTGKQWKIRSIIKHSVIVKWRSGFAG